MIKLPDPIIDGRLSIERALLARRSVREYAEEALSLMEVSQIVWSAQGITGSGVYRTAPSAGALYPLEVHVVAGEIDGVPAGVYRYKPTGHQLAKVADGDQRHELCVAALSQSSVRKAPALIVFSAVFERTTRRYGERGVRYVFMEAGHAAQNVSLQAVSLGLETVIIGAFKDHEVKKSVYMKEEEQPLLLMPLGKGVSTS